MCTHLGTVPRDLRQCNLDLGSCRVSLLKPPCPPTHPPTAVGCPRWSSEKIHVPVYLPPSLLLFYISFTATTSPIATYNLLYIIYEHPTLAAQKQHAASWHPFSTPPPPAIYCKYATPTFARPGVGVSGEGPRVAERTPTARTVRHVDGARRGGAQQVPGT